MVLLTISAQPETLENSSSAIKLIIKMSDHIPFEIQVEIMKRLPVKSLVQFRSVSQTWKSLIDSSQFITTYSNARGTQVQHLLVNSNYGYCYEDSRYVSIVDDHTFPRRKVSVPFPKELFKYCYICGCSNGLLCFKGTYHVVRGGGGVVSTATGLAVIWNPSIRKAVKVVVPNMGGENHKIYASVLGFGVCRETMDPKIVKITYIKRCVDIESIVSIPWQVEVFTLSSGTWRSSYSNLPHKSVQFNDCQRAVQVDGFLYWLATSRTAIGGGFEFYNLIVSFDMASEEFREVNIPDSIAYEFHSNRLLMYKVRESVVVVHDCSASNDDHSYTIWMMKDGVPKSFTKLCNLNTSDASLRGFRKGGEPVIEVEDNGHVILAVYDPHSKRFDILGIDRTKCASQVFPYMETLLLLDHPDSVTYNDL